MSNIGNLLELNLINMIYSIKCYMCKRHLRKFLIVFLIFAIVLMREISIYWISVPKNYGKYRHYDNNLRRLSYNQSRKINLEIERILSPIWAASEEQILIDPRIIIKTLRFMIEDKDETDPELIDFVRSLIVPPAKMRGGLKLNLKDPRKLNSSHTGSSKLIDKMLGERNNGFFIEAGGHDGEGISNSLFFELERSWTGILIEPVPSLYKSIEEKNRNAYILNACIANSKPIISRFRVHKALTGRLAEMNLKHQKRIDLESGTDLIKFGYFPCFSLKTIMKAIDVSHVDYFSLDVEGGELDVLKSINFNELDIETFSIEHNGFEETRDRITALMESNGYRTELVDGQDGYYIKS